MMDSRSKPRVSKENPLTRLNLRDQSRRPPCTRQVESRSNFARDNKSIRKIRGSLPTSQEAVRGFGERLCRLSGPLFRVHRWEHRGRPPSDSARGRPTPLTCRSSSSTRATLPCDQSALLRVRPQRLVGALLPAGARRTVRGDDIAIHTQADELLRGALLRTALSSVPANGRSRLRWQHVHERSRVANLLRGPLRVFRIRAPGVLSHRFVPRAGSRAAS